MIWNATLSLAMLFGAGVHADGPVHWLDSHARSTLAAYLTATAEFETTYTLEGPWVLTKALDPGQEYRKPSFDELLRLGSLPEDNARREIRTRFSRGCFLMEVVPANGAATERLVWNGEKSFLFTVDAQAGEADPTSLLFVERSPMSQFSGQISPNVFLAVDRLPGQPFLRDRTLLQLLDEADVSVAEDDDRIIIEAHFLSRSGSAHRTQRLVITMEAGPMPAIVRWDLATYAGDPRREEAKRSSRLVMTHDAIESFGGARIPSSSFVWYISTVSRADYVEYKRSSIRPLDDAESAELCQVPVADPKSVLQVQDLTLGISYQTGERWITVGRAYWFAPGPIGQIISNAAWINLVPTLREEM